MCSDPLPPPVAPRPPGQGFTNRARIFNAVKHWLGKVLGSICVTIFAGLVVVVMWQVLSRYLLAAPSSASEEIARILLMWLGLLGACYAHLDNQHIAIRFFPDLAPRRRDQAIMLLSQVFAMILLVGGAKLCWLTFQLHQTTPVLGLPVGVVYAVLPFCGLVLGLTNYLHWKEPPAQSKETTI